ncbi:hypothetical protein [Bacillus sp. FDAARGOS_235]|uniref:hypothetical protein n=1 Tax=Bacillus sp. FDAARGOS_235 TaxID=1839798 RepID=UPI002107180C|nr:hypothetical protein [Bacillus sp. FDAARGOS_235]
MERSLTIEFLQEEHLDVIQQFVCRDESEAEESLKEKAMIYHLRNMVRTRLFFDADHNLVVSLMTTCVWEGLKGRKLNLFLYREKIIFLLFDYII